jgi:hypothetical protein
MRSMRLAVHFLARILRFDVPLGAVGALLTWSRNPMAGSPVATATNLAIRFVVITCTAGYAVSFLLYGWFYRRELPLYTVCGYHLRSVALRSLGLLTTTLVALLVSTIAVLRLADQ